MLGFFFSTVLNNLHWCYVAYPCSWNINDKRQTTLDHQWSLTSPQQYADLYQLRKEPKIFFFQLLEGGGEMFNQTWKIPLDDSNKSNRMIVFMSKVFMWYLSICIKRLLAL